MVINQKSVMEQNRLIIIIRSIPLSRPNKVSLKC